MAMINMKLEKNGESEELYPEDLVIELGIEQLKKLGLTAGMRLGSTVTITARAYVAETSTTMVEGGMEPSVELQITDLEIGQAGTMDAAATMLYGG
jgi:hypothetical protein